MAKTSRLNPSLWFRVYVRFMAQRLPVDHILPPAIMSGILFGFTWGCAPLLKTFFVNSITIELFQTFSPAPLPLLTTCYYMAIALLHVVGSIPISRILLIYNPDYFDLYRDE